MDNATLKFLVVLAAAAIVLYLMTRSDTKAEKFVVDIRDTGDEEEDPVPSAIDKALAQSTQLPPALGVASSMLPKPSDPGFFGQFAPDPKELTGQNFVDATRWTSLGAMTSRRNINRDIRAEIPVPKNNSVSPWNNSTIDQQVAGVPLC
jgi:hypothetical protein